MSKEELRYKLIKYFSINNDTYHFHLTRVKEAIEYGTLTVDDFVEFNEDSVNDIVEYLFR